MNLVSNFKSTASLNNSIYYRPYMRMVADTTIYIYGFDNWEEGLPTYVIYILTQHNIHELPLYLIYLCCGVDCIGYTNNMGNNNIIYCDIYRNKGKFLYHRRYSELKIGKDFIRVTIVRNFNKVVYLKIEKACGCDLVEVWFDVNGDLIKTTHEHKDYRILLNAIYVIRERIKIIPQSLYKLDFVNL